MKIKWDKSMILFLKNANGKKLSIGVVSDDMYDKNEDDKKKQLSPAGKVLVHEFGSIAMGIPARPFLRPAVLNKKNINSALKKAIKTKSLKSVGSELQGDVRLYLDNLEVGQTWKGITIKDIKQSTKEKKGSDAILVDTGAMKQSITYVVE